MQTISKQFAKEWTHRIAAVVLCVFRLAGHTWEHDLTLMQPRQVACLAHERPCVKLFLADRRGPGPDGLDGLKKMASRSSLDCSLSLLLESLNRQQPAEVWSVLVALRIDFPS